MKKSAGLVVALMCLALCSKTPEQKGDSFLKNGDKKRAYLYYQKAVQASQGKPAVSLLNKYLDLTVDKARERLTQDESLESVDLFAGEWAQYGEQCTDPAVKDRYALFLCDWADSVFLKTADAKKALSLYEEAVKDAVSSQEPAQRSASLREKLGRQMLEQAKETFAKAKKENAPLDLVGAEYYTLVAAKYLPQDTDIRALLQQTRKENLSTYSAYNRAMEDGQTDPEIDRCNVYIAITGTKNGGIQGSIYNLSADPLELHSKFFTAIDKNGGEHTASLESKFEKISIDVKMESKFTLQFPSLKGNPQRIIFKEDKRMAEKWFPE